jgi:hypothetical protein
MAILFSEALVAEGGGVRQTGGVDRGLQRFKSGGEGADIREPTS